MKNIIRTFAITAALACAAGTAEAQTAAPEARSKTTGLHLGLHLNGSAVRNDGSDVTGSGSGLGLHAGYGITPHVSIFARMDVASMEKGDYALAHADLGLRLSLAGSGSAFRPFVQGAVGARGVAIEDPDLEAYGIAFTGGGGLEYFVSRRVAVEGGLSLTLGKFTQARQGESGWTELQDGGIAAISRRFDIGISWHP